MKIIDKQEKKSQIELLVELSQQEFKEYIDKASKKISQEVKIDGFRSGKIPYEVLKQKIGEMSILEEAAKLAINKTLDKVILEFGAGKLIGRPKVDIVKLAPDNPLQYKLTAGLIPEITLGKYKDLKVKAEKPKISDTDVERTLSELREMRASEALVNREIKKGDKTMIDIQMFQDNVPVEGGQANATAVIIGNDYIVPGFDKKLIGAKKGAKLNFSLPYPAEHYMKNLAGKMVDFKISVKEIYERKMPKLDDELAKSLGMKKLSELKDNIKKNMQTEKNKESEKMAEKKMLEELIQKAKFGDIPEILIGEESNNMLAELKNSITQQGGKFDDYLSSINKTEDKIKVDLMPDALKRVKVSLLIREIAKQEKIKVPAEEIKHKIKHMKEHYKDNKDILKQMDSPDYYNYMVNVLTSEKVVKKLREWNIIKA